MSQRSVFTSVIAWLAALTLISGGKAVGVSPADDAGDLQPRRAWIKPERFEMGPHDQPGAVWVKFHDGLSIRLRNGDLSDLGTGALAEAERAMQALPAGLWERMYGDVREQRLDELRDRAEAVHGRRLGDLNLEFIFRLDDDGETESAVNALNALDVVELAIPFPAPLPPPVPPDFQPNQGYLDPSPTGVSAIPAWNGFPTLGEGVRIVDIEYDFNADHLDLPPVPIIGPPHQGGVFGPEHGTAVLGVLGAISNGWGTTGIAPEADLLFAGTIVNNVWNLPAAVLVAVDALDPGDIILIEQQVAGPLYDPQTPSQFGLLPVEWSAPVYNAVVTAVGNGITVVIPSANGAQNLDDALYSSGNFGHWPFLPENDSGAIYVGAGAAASGFGGSDVPLSRLAFSNFGSRLNLQGWGEAIWTTGFGHVWSAEGTNLYYTHLFGGTSGAGAIVAGAAALLQSAYMDFAGGVVLDPLELRGLLIETGVAQQSGSFPATQHIGPQPDVWAAINSVLPANQICTEGMLIGTDEPVEFSTIGASLDGPEEPGCFAAGGGLTGDIWFNHLATDCQGGLIISLGEMAAATGIAVYGFDCPQAPGTALACQAVPGGADAEVFVPAGPPGYRIRIGGLGGQQTAGVMTLACAPADARCPGDINADGVVNVDDLLLLLAAWGQCDDADGCPADINGDGVVDVDDLLALLAQWGEC